MSVERGALNGAPQKPGILRVFIALGCPVVGYATKGSKTRAENHGKSICCSKGPFSGPFVTMG